LNEPLNILIIDDDPTDRNAVKRALTAANRNLHVTEARDAAEGIKFLAQENFDCALLDYRLPDRDGLALVRDIRDAGVQIPIIVLTGHGNEHLAVELLKAGASDYLVKADVSLNHLSQSVCSAVRVHRAEKNAAASKRQMQEHEAAMLAREKQLRAQAESANAAKDRFLAVLSHELRTPLMPVLSLIEVLQREECLPPDAKEAVEVIRRNVELEARLIDDLLDLTRITRGTLELNRQTIDVHHWIHQAVDLWRPDPAGQQIQWQLHLSATRSIVHADPGRLSQMFWNLLRNAVKFTAPGGSIEIHTHNPDAQSLVVEVIDTGIGIDDTSLSHIFEAFNQGRGALTAQSGGLGLGLTISKALVEAHGGDIKAISAGANRGATFRVTLPLHVTTESKAPINRREFVGPRRILLVDDHPDTRRAMQRLLTKMGHEVRTAYSVQSALDLAKQHSFDLLISDIGLPDGTGVDLIAQIRSIQPMPGIALSGYGMDEDIRRSKEAGFVDHLTKPINFNRLEQLIAQTAQNETR
jgi:signal transduction histidine kinase